MAGSHTSLHLAEPPKRGAHPHRVQFYEDDAFLGRVVAEYVGDGLSAGESVVILATPSHREAFTQAIAALGHVPAELERAGRLTVLDARQTLERFMVGAMPDWSLFKETIGDLLRRASDAAPAHRVRAYGEMVDVLWSEGRPAAALRLEEFWNDLAQLHRFSLLCTYVMRNFRTHAEAEGFAQVCAAHSHVTPTEEFGALDSEDARLREIARLQQNAQALETELARRADVEQKLLAALALRDEFLAVAGHELRTPLTAMRLQMQNLVRHLEKEREVDVPGRLKRIVGHAERISLLVDGLLDVSRITLGRLELRREAVDLGALVSEAVDRCASEAALAECTLQVSAESSIVGWWDRLRLEQLVSNLLANALKYGRGAPVEVTAKRLGDRAQVVIRDHEIGIAGEDHGRIFERFERAASTSSFAGLGLGLWLSRQIAEAHGGSVQVDSELGRGATFYVELPLTAAPAT